MAGSLIINIEEQWDEGSIESFLESAQVSHGIAYRGPDWFRWKFEQSPYGSAIIAVARDEKGGIAGAVAYGRWRLRLGRETIRAALSYETFVHSDHRGQGLFVALADLAARRAKEDGVEVLFNFPNPASRPGFLKLGWRDMGGIQTWIRPCAPLKVLLAICKRRSTALGPLVPDPPSPPPISWIPPRWLKDMPKAGPPGVLLSDRPWTLLQWRFFARPISSYEVVNCQGVGCIFRSGVRGPLKEAQIMDVFPTDRGGLQIRWAKALRGISRAIAERGKYHAISMITTPGTEYADALPSAGFICVPNHASFLCLPFSPRMEHIVSNRQWALTATDIHTF